MVFLRPVQNGKTKYTIENATKTRVVLADTKIHILGSYQSIRVARDALCSLILGSPPGKVHDTASPPVACGSPWFGLFRFVRRGGFCALKADVACLATVRYVVRHRHATHALSWLACRYTAS